MLKHFKQILIIALFMFVSCGSLELKVSTQNHLSTIDRFNQLKKQEVNTDLFSINAPLINGWIFDNKYGNSWEYSEFARYPQYRWQRTDRMYNIPPVVRSTPNRPKVKLVPVVNPPSIKTKQ